MLLRKTKRQKYLELNVKFIMSKFLTLFQAIILFLKPHGKKGYFDKLNFKSTQNKDILNTFTLPFSPVYLTKCGIVNKLHSS